MIKSSTMKSVPKYDEIISFFESYGFTGENIAPLVVLGIIFYLLIRFDLLRGLKNSIDTLSKKMGSVERCIVELQSVVRNSSRKKLVETLYKYSVTNSPVVLKKEFRKFITPDLRKQVEEKKDGLVKWLENKSPQTGIDAQADISLLVSSGEIRNYLDLTAYNRNLYQKGKTPSDADGILAVYLFEVLIPELKMG